MLFLKCFILRFLFNFFRFLYLLKEYQFSENFPSFPSFCYLIRIPTLINLDRKYILSIRLRVSVLMYHRAHITLNGSLFFILFWLFEGTYMTYFL